MIKEPYNYADKLMIKEPYIKFFQYGYRGWHPGNCEANTNTCVVMAEGFIKYNDRNGFFVQHGGQMHFWRIYEGKGGQCMVQGNPSDLGGFPDLETGKPIKNWRKGMVIIMEVGSSILSTVN